MAVIRALVLLLAAALPCLGFVRGGSRTGDVSPGRLPLVCAAWTREIGPIYPKTDVGPRAPLRMVDIKRDRPNISLKTPVIYTPTFVLAEQGREVGRIEGYAGDQFFWGQLENLMQQLPPGSSSDLSTNLSPAGTNERSEPKP